MRQTGRRVLVEERSLVLGEHLAQRALARHRLTNRRLRHTLERGRAHVPAGEGVDLDDELGQLPQRGRQLGGDHRPQLDHRIVAATLHPPRPGDHTGLVEIEVGGVEEEHLTDLGVERIHTEGGRRRPVRMLRQGQLELDAVRALHQLAQLARLVTDQTCVRRHDYIPSVWSSSRRV